VVPGKFCNPATSLAYVAGAFGAKIFLGEQLNATRWAEFSSSVSA